MKCIRDSVRQLTEYFVAQDNALAKLNQNECPYDLPAILKQKVVEKLRERSWNRYPALRVSHLAETIAAYTRFPRSGIMIGNGSNEMIQVVFSSVCDVGDRVLLVSPGFSVYPRVAKLMGLEIVEVPLLEDFGFDTSAIIEKSDGVRMIIFASPNNPTGTAINIAGIEEIVQAAEGLLVIDEAYFEFYRETAQDLLNRYDNLIILRTFSKAFGLAGIRLGYLLARPEVVHQLQKAKLPFSVGIFQQIVGEVVMNDTHYTQEIVNSIITERERMFLGLQEMSTIMPIPSLANFILFEVKQRLAAEIYKSLYEKRVLVRYFDTHRLENMLRVTIGTPTENDLFLECLQKILAKT